MRITDITLLQAIEQLNFSTQYEKERFITIAIIKQMPKKPNQLETKTHKSTFGFVKCPICNSTIPEASAFCMYCGQKLDWE